MRFFRLSWPVAGLVTTLIGLAACSDDDSIPDLHTTHPPDSGVTESDSRSAPTTDVDPTEAASRSTNADTSDLGPVSGTNSSSASEPTWLTTEGASSTDANSENDDSTNESGSPTTTTESVTSVEDSTSRRSSSDASSSDPDDNVTSTSETFGANTLDGSSSLLSTTEEATPDAGADGSVTEVSSGSATDPTGDRCGGAAELSIFGNYLTRSGDEVWLRNSGNGITLTRVPAGAPMASRLPQLWDVIRTCSVTQTLVVRNEEARFTRVDWLSYGGTLLLCIAESSTEVPDAVFDVDAANGSDPSTSGCNGGAWLSLTSGDN